MSRVEVDKIQQQCGTTLTVGGGACKTAVVDATTVTLGRCGGTVSLASGATQSGFGRTGTVDWQTGSIKTATFSATNGEGYFANTSGGAFTMNLPAGVAGNIVSVVDYTNSWQTYSLTVTPNGADKIGGTNAAAILNTEGQSVTFVFVDSTEGWKNVQDSTSAIVGNEFMVATVSGACNTLVTAPDCANTKIATFKGPGTFCVSQVHPCAANNLVSYLVSAGGGGGSGGPSGDGGGGGGAGGFRETKSPVTPYTASPLDGYPSAPNRITATATPYPIGVGGGGPGTDTYQVAGVSGTPSTFSTITGTGGGGGGGNATLGVAGGSGGGGGGGGSPPGANTFPGGSGNTPPTTPAQGFAGGTGGANGPGGDQRGAGGGGATAVGQDSQPPNLGGNGGAGATTSITASPVAYAGGGGGYSPSTVPCTPSGGSGGGGDGGASGTGATSGGCNSSGGGGGAGSSGPPTSGGGGGSGIVVIRYKFQ